ncbi:MAG: prohibitin family protein [Thiolinea sp.]
MEKNKKVSIYSRLIRWAKRKAAIIILIVLIVFLFTAYFWERIFITINSGEAGVLFRRLSGTQIDRVYSEGFYIINPINKLYVYETRKQVAFHDFDVISNKGLTIHLSLAVRYRPEYDLLGILHQQIGPNYLNRVILPQIESVMRKQLGEYTAEEIYTNKEGLLTNAILTALDEVGRNYVEVEDIIIRSIALPDKIVVAIEKKLEQEEFMKSYEFRLSTARKEAERLEIEAGGINKFHKIVDESLTEAILTNKGIEATRELAESDNAKVVVIGGGKNGLPIILNTDPAAPTVSNLQKPANDSKTLKGKAESAPTAKKQTANGS